MTYTYPEVIQELHTPEPDPKFDNNNPRIQKLKRERMKLHVKLVETPHGYEHGIRRKLFQLTQQINKLR